MKCPTCESCEYEQYYGATEIMRKCERHNKKVKQTNEEWFCQLPTAEKSEFLSAMAKEAIEVYEKHGTTWHEAVSWWDGWLKAKHE